MKAIIVSGGVQHIVAEGDKLEVNYVGDMKSFDLTPVMLVDGKNSVVDPKKLETVKVSVKVLDQMQGDKVIALRYKAKKRVHTVRGHRQKLSKIEIVSIK